MDILCQKVNMFTDFEIKLVVDNRSCSIKIFRTSVRRNRSSIVVLSLDKKRL